MFLIIVDAHSKWPEVLLTGSTSSERTVELLREVFSRHGLPEHLQSDNGRQFTSEVFQNFMKANDIKHTFSAQYHPATNGQAERFVQTFKQAMKAAKGDLGAVKLHLAKFLLAYRNATHATTGESPAMLLLGRGPRTRLDAVRPDTRKTVERRQAISVEQKRGKDRSFSVGEKVAVRNYRDDQRWIAGIIQEKKGTRAYTVQVGDTVWRRHSDQIRASDMAPAPAPDMVTSEQVVLEPREPERDVSANVQMGTPSIVMDQPVKRSTQRRHHLGS